MATQPSQNLVTWSIIVCCLHFSHLGFLQLGRSWWILPGWGHSCSCSHLKHQLGQYPKTVSPVWQLGGPSACVPAPLHMADHAGRLGLVGRSCQSRAGEQKQWPLEAQTWKSCYVRSFAPSWSRPRVGQPRCERWGTKLPPATGRAGSNLWPCLIHRRLNFCQIPLVSSRYANKRNNIFMLQQWTLRKQESSVI